MGAAALLLGSVANGVHIRPKSFMERCQDNQEVMQLTEQLYRQVTVQLCLTKTDHLRLSSSPNTCKLALFWWLGRIPSYFPDLCRGTTDAVPGLGLEQGEQLVSCLAHFTISLVSCTVVTILVVAMISYLVSQLLCSFQSIRILFHPSVGRSRMIIYLDDQGFHVSCQGQSRLELGSTYQ